MKLCKSCGREIADDAVFCQSCLQEQKDEKAKKETLALDAASRTFPVFIILGAALIGAGVASALFLNYLIGIAVLLVSEILCYIPTFEIKRAVKKSNPDLSQLERSERAKEMIEKMKNTNLPYKICRAVALVALVAILAVILMNV